MSSTIIPALRYKDAPAAIEFLTKAFGFEVQMVVEGENDTIEHAQLVHGTGMIMLGSHRDDDFGQLLGSDGRSSLYVIVDDVSAHAGAARAAGADIVSDTEEQDYGGSNYVARDPEGHIWSFGDYSPWVGD
ncbi:MAG: VOC family protein [Acidimicrobiia bacterium]|nr:VOC family protein [Acidimicrobiia bacterium]